MLPRDVWLKLIRIEGDRVVPHYLAERDQRWLGALLAEYASSVGRKRAELERRLREPLPFFAPRAKLRAAVHVLSALARDRVEAAVPPREARWLAFSGAATSGLDRAAVIAEVAEKLEVSESEIEAALFADLRGEQRVTGLEPEISAPRLAIETNLALAASLLRRATCVSVTIWGGIHDVVRQARRSGLICAVSPPRQGEPHVLEISGPFALFRHTETYGRSLAALIPELVRCLGFELRAECLLGRSGPRFMLVVRTGDPLGLGLEPRLQQSPLERRLARDFRSAAPDWELVAEPPALELAGGLVFPDFELFQRRAPEQRWLLELAGFWTRDYLERRLRQLETSGFERLLLCIDEKRSCAEDALPASAHIFRHRGRIDPRALLAHLAARRGEHAHV